MTHDFSYLSDELFESFQQDPRVQVLFDTMPWENDANKVLRVTFRDQKNKQHATQHAAVLFYTERRLRKEEWRKHGTHYREGGLPNVLKYALSYDGVGNSKHYLQTEMWYHKNKVHRQGDLPAIQEKDPEGQIYIWAWCLNGKFHRQDKPAIIRRQITYDKEGSIKEITDLHRWLTEGHTVIDSHWGEEVKITYTDWDGEKLDPPRKVVIRSWDFFRSFVGISSREPYRVPFYEEVKLTYSNEKLSDISISGGSEQSRSSKFWQIYDRLPVEEKRELLALSGQDFMAS